MIGPTQTKCDIENNNQMSHSNSKEKIFFVLWFDFVYRNCELF